MNFRSIGRDKERGATLVEAAIVYGLLFLALFSIIEFGLAFRDWLSVSHASREGARAGATFGQDDEADILILREVESVMAPIGFPVDSQVRIFNAETGDGTLYTYKPGNLSDCSNQATLPDCCDWSPCPEPGRDLYDEPDWTSLERDVEAPDTSRIGVEVTKTHDWVTGFLADTTVFTVATDFQLEPEVFSPDTG